MNYITHLNAFFKKAENDVILTPYHLSLYLALFRIWNANCFEDTITINRQSIMKKAKIGSKKTYYDCLNYLDAGGYLQYIAAASRFDQAKVIMRDLSGAGSRTHHLSKTLHHESTSDTACVPDQGHFTKEAYKQRVNNPPNGTDGHNIPSLDEVIAFAQESGYSSASTHAFWHRFSTNNWRSGGKPIRDWKALAHAYLAKVDANNNQNKNDGTDDTAEYKDYQEPL